MTLEDLKKIGEILADENGYVELCLSPEKRKELDDMFNEGDGVDFIQPNRNIDPSDRFISNKYDMMKYMGYTFLLPTKLS